MTNYLKDADVTNVVNEFLSDTYYIAKKNSDHKKMVALLSEANEIISYHVKVIEHSPTKYQKQEKKYLQIFSTYFLLPIKHAKEANKLEIKSNDERRDERLICLFQQGVEELKESIISWKSSVFIDNILIKLSESKLNSTYIIKRLVVTIAILLLVMMPFKYIFNIDQNILIEASQNILRIIIPSSIGLLGLVITSTTFLANFFKDTMKEMKFLSIFDTGRKEVAELINYDYRIIADSARRFYNKNITEFNDYKDVSNISRELKRLAHSLIYLILLSLTSLIATFIPTEINTTLLWGGAIIVGSILIHSLLIINTLIHIISDHLLLNVGFINYMKRIKDIKK